MKVINDDDDFDDDDERKKSKKAKFVPNDRSDQVMSINSVQKSSKSELSSWGKRPFKTLLCSAVRHYLPSDTIRVFFFRDATEIKTT